MINQTLEKYAAKTKYNMEQWLGRLAPPVILADYYDREELMAVAKVHFPEFPEKLLALVCSRAMQSEAYLKGMEFAARYASALALDRRHRTPTVQDVDEAIERMMPSKAKLQPVDRTSADALQPLVKSRRGSLPASEAALQSRLTVPETAIPKPFAGREIVPGSLRNRVADLDAVPG